MRYILLLWIVGCLCLTSCTQEDSSQIGEDFTGVDTRVYFIDTLTVETSTFQFDSLIVTDRPRLLIGSYNDPYFGRTTSNVYSKLGVSTYDIDHEAIYDSIKLILRYDQYFYNDTIPTQEFKVFEVTEDIEPDDDDEQYYNLTDFEYNPTPIGTQQFQPKPNKVDSLNIDIDDAWGETLFEKIRDNDINNIDEFLREYKGILISPSDNNTAVLGFDKSSVLRLYYSIDNEIEFLNQTADFGFSQLDTYSQTISDKTGTHFETLTDQEISIPSTSTDNYCFIQSGTGIATKIDIPNIKSLDNIPGDGAIINAQLKISLKREASPEYFPTQDNLQVFIIDNKSNVISTLTYDDGSTPVSGIITNNDPEFETDLYVFFNQATHVEVLYA